MKRIGRRPFLVTCVLAAVLTGVCLAEPALPEALGVDLWNLPVSHRLLRQEYRVSSDLAARDAAVLRRLELKAAVVQLLIEGRMTLAQAADEFSAMHGTDPVYWEMLRRCYPGRTDQ